MSELDKDLAFCDERCDPLKSAQRVADRFELLVKALIDIRLEVDQSSTSEVALIINRVDSEETDHE